jgi:hypothetical protein
LRVNGQLYFEIEQRFRKLEELIISATDKNLDELAASYLCRLGSVLICGNLERCVELVLTTRFANRAPPQIGTFIKAYFRRGTNYDCEQIVSCSTASILNGAERSKITLNKEIISKRAFRPVTQSETQ